MDEINFIDDNHVDEADWSDDDDAVGDRQRVDQKEVEDIVASYNVAIIVLSTLLSVGIVFGCIFVYYYKVGL